MAPSCYIYAVAVTVLSMAPRDPGAYWPWLIAVGSLLAVVSAALVSIDLMRGQPGSLQVGLFWTGVIIGAVLMLIASLATVPLVFAHTCCPGYYALSAWLVLAAVAALAVIGSIVYVPAAVAILHTSASSDSAAWRSVRFGLTLALAPAVLSIVLAPHYFQDIGGVFATAEAGATVLIALLIGVAMVLLPSSRWARLPMTMPTRYLVPACALLVLLIGYQAVVPPPDDPGLVAKTTSGSITLFAPAGHPDLMREAAAYQAEWIRLQAQDHAPDLTFDVMFDGIPPLRPRHYAAGEWDVKAKISQTPQERLDSFRRDLTAVIAYYRTLP